MVRPFIEMLLGEVGRQILFFYEANALVINTVVLTYGLLMYAAWINLLRIYRFMVVDIAKQIHLNEKLNRKSTVKRAQDNINFPWEVAVKHSPLPIIGRIAGLIPKRKTIENLKYYFDEKELVADAIAVMKGQNIYKLTPNFKKIMDKETEEIKQRAKKN
jgi:hypothetical protein